MLQNNRGHEAVRIVNQAKINNLRYRASRMLGIESGLEQEDINDGLKKAFIALQTKDRRGFESNYDQISQLLQLGKVDGQFIRENNELLKETMETIYGEIIPERQLTEKVIDAFKERSVNRLGSIGSFVPGWTLYFLKNFGVFVTSK